MDQAKCYPCKMFTQVMALGFCIIFWDITRTILCSGRGTNQNMDMPDVVTMPKTFWLLQMVYQVMPRCCIIIFLFCFTLV